MGGNIVASFTDVSNRGRIFGLNQTFQNFGKIVGPMVATNLAVHGLGPIKGFYALPFYESGSLTLTAACVMLASTKIVKPEAQTTPQATPKMEKKVTTFG